jgi:transcriptional regulator with XRE-family HTH domain
MFSMKENYTRLNYFCNTQMNDYLRLDNSCAYSSVMDIGSRLDKAMKTAGYETQAALEKASGVPQPTIARILKGGGKRGPETSTLLKLASACGVTFNWLMEGDGRPIEVAPRQIREISQETRFKTSLSYITDEELELLTFFRQSTDDSKQIIVNTASRAPKDPKRLKSTFKKVV